MLICALGKYNYIYIQCTHCHDESAFSTLAFQDLKIVPTIDTEGTSPALNYRRVMVPQFSSDAALPIAGTESPKKDPMAHGREVSALLGGCVLSNEQPSSHSGKAPGIERSLLTLVGGDEPLSEDDVGKSVDPSVDCSQPVEGYRIACAGESSRTVWGSGLTSQADSRSRINCCAEAEGSL